MKVTKTKKVRTPEFGTSGSAGIDFFIPDDFTQTILMPRKDVLIPSGIKCEVPKGCVLIAFNKSGIATKKKLQVGACVVDEDYTGEIHLHVYNWSDSPIILNPGDKLTQFVLLKYGRPTIELVDADSIFINKQTQRSESGFGSTDLIGLNEKIEVKPTIRRIQRINGKVAYVVKIDPNKESQKGGTYQRHHFRDVDNPQIHYILDVNKHTSGVFKHLNIGDTLMGLQTFNMNNKDYINGRSRAIQLGKYDKVKNELINKIGFEI
jgi:dUTP pyrophosphatase